MEIEELTRYIIERHDVLDSWRAVGRELTAKYGIKVSHGMAWMLACKPGYEPKRKMMRSALGLSVSSEVVVVNGQVENGSETLGSEKCKVCGSPFISNHWARQKCFRCSPYRGKRR